MPFIWCLGSIVGPALGGLLAEPTKFYPGVFPPGGIFEEYPYLLPNMVASVVLVLGIFNGIFFLEETHDVLKHKRDYGRELGQKMIEFFKFGQKSEDASTNGESEGLLSAHGNGTGYNTVGPMGGQVERDDLDLKPPAVVSVFTRPVVGIIISYGILAYQ